MAYQAKDYNSLIGTLTGLSEFLLRNQFGY